MGGEVLPVMGRRAVKALSCIRGLLVLFTLLALQAAPGFAATLPRRQQEFMYVEGDKLMLGGEQFVMKGFNYYPKDYGWTSMADWDWEAVDQELALAASLGANTIRTGISFQYTTGNIDGQKDIYATYRVLPEHLDALDRLLALAEKHQLKVVLWLADTLYWELWDPAHFDTVKNHLETLIPHYADDTRIAAWDLMTDVDGAMLLPIGAGGAGLEIGVMVTFLRNMSSAVNELDPNHLVTIGFCWPSSVILAQDFTDFLMPQFLGGDHPEIVSQPALSGEAEDYGQWDQVLVDKEAVVARLEQKVRSIQSQIRRPMPFVLAEYGIYTASPSSPELQQGVYEAVLELAFLRMKLAGALNWALTDFVWPPKAFTLVPDDAPMSTPAEQTFGVFDLDYAPKPAAEVARIYYSDRPTISMQTAPDELVFTFNKSFTPADLDPESDDMRLLNVAFDTIEFRDADGGVLLQLDIGDPSARPFLKCGFHADEGAWGREAESFAWTDGSAEAATVSLPFPTGTHQITFRALTSIEGMRATVSVEGEKLAELPITTEWRSYHVDLSVKDQLSVGDTVTTQGRFDIPISEGTITIQVSSDGRSWSDAATAIPMGGEFCAEITLTQIGKTYVRAAWGGGGYYQSATSDTVGYEVTAALVVATVTVSPSSSTSAATAVPQPEGVQAEALGERLPYGLYIGLAVAIGVVIAALVVIFALKRKKPA
jgi:hypothetical protein